MYREAFDSDPNKDPNTAEGKQRTPSYLSRSASAVASISGSSGSNREGSVCQAVAVVLRLKLWTVLCTSIAF